MESIVSIKIMNLADKIKLRKKYVIWIMLYGIIIIVGSQVLIYYLYKDINAKAHKFIADEIQNEKIIDFDTLRYTPGKGTYEDIILSNKKNYPLFLATNEFRSQISTLSIINKKSNDNNFEIKNESGVFYFTIQAPESQYKFMRLFILLISVFIIGSVFYKYGIDKGGG